MQILDPVLIILYRLTGYPLVDYYLGTFLLALLTVLVGEFTISIVFQGEQGPPGQAQCSRRKDEAPV